MTQNVIMLLQALAGGLQFFNLGLAAMQVHISPVVHVGLGAILVTLQVYLQAQGNKSVPPDTQAMIDAALKQLAEGKK